MIVAMSAPQGGSSCKRVVSAAVSTSRPPLCGDLSIDDVPSDSLSDLSDDVFATDVEDAYYVEIQGDRCHIRGPHVDTVMTYDSGLDDTSVTSQPTLLSSRTHHDIEAAPWRHHHTAGAERLKLTRVGGGGGGRLTMDEDEDVDDDDESATGALVLPRYQFPPSRSTRRYFRPVSVDVNPAEIARAKADLFTSSAAAAQRGPCAKTNDVVAVSYLDNSACVRRRPGLFDSLSCDADDDTDDGSATSGGGGGGGGVGGTHNSEALFAKYYSRCAALSDAAAAGAQPSPPTPLRALTDRYITATAATRPGGAGDVLSYNTPLGGSSCGQQRRSQCRNNTTTCTAGHDDDANDDKPPVLSTSAEKKAVCTQTTAAVAATAVDHTSVTSAARRGSQQLVVSTTTSPSPSAHDNSANKESHLYQGSG